MLEVPDGKKYYEGVPRTLSKNDRAFQLAMAETMAMAAATADDKGSRCRWSYQIFGDKDFEGRKRMRRERVEGIRNDPDYVAGYGYS